MDKETFAKLTQFIKFSAVGATNTVISYLIYVAILAIMQGKNVSWDYMAANIISFTLSVLWSFYWNNKYVFAVREGEHRSVTGSIVKTYVSYSLTGIVLNNMLSFVWISVLGISKYLAPFINLCLTVPLNFVLNKMWTFKANNKVVNCCRKTYE